MPIYGNCAFLMRIPHVGSDYFKRSLSSKFILLKTNSTFRCGRIYAQYYIWAGSFLKSGNYAIKTWDNYRPGRSVYCVNAMPTLIDTGPPSIVFFRMFEGGTPRTRYTPAYDYRHLYMALFSLLNFGKSSMW